MEITVSSPATLLDMAELGGAVTRLQWAVLREMHAAGQTWTVSVDGRPVLLAGLYPAGNGAEAWFNARPGAEAAMLPIVRQIRLTLAEAPYREIVTICMTEAGRRIARATGFAFVSKTEIGDIWKWTPSSETPPRSRPRRSSAAHSPTSPNSRARSTSNRPPAAAPAGAAAAAS